MLPNDYSRCLGSLEGGTLICGMREMCARYVEHDAGGPVPFAEWLCQTTGFERYISAIDDPPQPRSGPQE